MLIALLDANVLYPAPLRDFLVRLSITGVFAARWTAEIHNEWMRNVLANRPDLTHQQLQRTCDLMNSAVRDCMVAGYHQLIDTLVLPDTDDRHVLAAAIHARAEIIVTFNRKDFPAAALAPYGIEAQHPDEFVSGLLDTDEAAVTEAARRQRAALKNPPKSVKEFLEILEQQALTRTVARLRTLSGLL
jgi:predicted nucleic acid-binding protein